jgi:predicted TIM-barrel fold metal-dependent hydrolase
MHIIDIHTHIYPSKVARKATESVRDFYQLKGAVEMDGTAQMLLSRGKEAGISRFVVLPVSNTPGRVRSINSFILEQTALHEEFVGFGTLHADMENLEEEAQWILCNGLRGIKMHPDSQRFPIDDPRLYPVYDAIQGRCPVLLHMGDQRYNYSHPVRLRRVLEIFPRLEVIAAHFGGYSMFHTAKELLWDTDCVFDISSAMMFMEQGEAERYINGYGAERMAYGTDYPLWDPVKEVQRFKELKLTDEQFDQIAHKTAERILKLK